jgi:hypothetical protein
MLIISPEVSAANATGIYACLAACLGGAFTLIGLLISKDQRVSEFRQAWIDELRKDIAELIAHSHQIHAYIFGLELPMLKGDPRYETYLNATRDDFIELNKASTRIKLRLNREECDSRLILDSMSELENIFGAILKSPNLDSVEKIKGVADALERIAPPLLKKEWNRVKRGENIYYFARWGALLLFALAGLSAYILWLHLAY